MNSAWKEVITSLSRETFHIDLRLQLSVHPYYVYTMSKIYFGIYFCVSNNISIYIQRNNIFIPQPNCKKKQKSNNKTTTNKKTKKKHGYAECLFKSSSWNQGQETMIQKQQNNFITSTVSRVETKWGKEGWKTTERNDKWKQWWRLNYR